MTEQDGISILNTDYDLFVISNIELADLMKTQCKEYDRAGSERATAILEVWASVVRIAEEIVRRKRQ